jgi:hypothetical protein
VTALALVLEAFAAVAAVGGGHLLAAGAAHVIATVAAVAGLGGRRRDERFFVAALVLALPVAGLAGLAAIRLSSRVMPVATDASEHASLETLPVPDRPQESLDAMFGWIQAELAVQPLGDAIRGADPESQRWAVGLLERRGDAAAVALLREALQAASRQTQVLASAALRRIEERLVRDVERARHGVAETPTPAAWTTLGEACRAFAGSGLVEAAVRTRALDEAAGAYGGARALDPAHRPALVGLARTRLEQDRPAEAETLARHAEATAASAETDLMLAEALFAQGRWTDVVATCRVAADAGRAHDLVAWWAGA